MIVKVKTLDYSGNMSLAWGGAGGGEGGVSPDMYYPLKDKK